MKQHHQDVSNAQAAMHTLRLLQQGLRPFPCATLTLPSWCLVAYESAITMGPYNGEPRMDKPLLKEPVRQLWVPRWIDIIVELWSGPISLEGNRRLTQRDNVLHKVKVLWTSSMKQQIVDAYGEDLRAVRALLKPVIVGPPPMLISEFEKMGGRVG